MPHPEQPTPADIEAAMRALGESARQNGQEAVQKVEASDELAALRASMLNEADEDGKQE